MNTPESLQDNPPDSDGEMLRVEVTRILKENEREILADRMSDPALGAHVVEAALELFLRESG